MSAECARDDLQSLSRAVPEIKVVALEAHVMPITAYGGQVMHSWFDYFTDFEGEKEDAVCLKTLREHRVTIQRLVWSEKSRGAPLVILAGLSQGGCMAVDVACREPAVDAVMTCVAHRLYCCRHRALLCPWYALVAANDEVFPQQWRCTLGATSVTVAEDSDHFLPDGEMSTFFTFASALILARIPSSATLQEPSSSRSTE